MGDKSDNIPGVPGIGEKTAVKLLRQFGTVENVLASIDEIKGEKLKETLRQHREMALLSKKLAAIRRDAPVELSLDDIAYQGEDREKVVALFKELGFQSFLEKMESPSSEEEKTACQDGIYAC
ncbi:hypothetical protein DI43_14385 [Geobacillus sp. CAMR12739]|nr:hypothetical protein DI43_14385 [Geobacillus sp. CAMR12739]